MKTSQIRSDRIFDRPTNFGGKNLFMTGLVLFIDKLVAKLLLDLPVPVEGWTPPERLALMNTKSPIGASGGFRLRPG